MTRSIQCALLLLLAPAAALAAPAWDLDRLQQVPRYELPGALVQKAVQQVRDKGLPMQFAVGMPTDLRLSEGQWDFIDADTARWRLRVASAQALSLNLELSNLQLPPSAQLWLYDAQGRVIQGPYTQGNASKSGKLWTAMTPGEEAVLELRVASAEQSRAGLSINKINHGFRGLTTGSKAGSCNINAACPEGDAWRDEIRSVAQISIGGQFICTGQLINNAQQNQRPLFLTANHCGIGNAGTPAESVVFYWNFQSSQCGSNPDSNLNQNQSGSTLLARDAESDFSLVELSQPPSPAFNVYFSGWNNGLNPPQSGISIHHPDGDRVREDSHKRLAVYSSPASATDVFVAGQLTHAWQVQWSKGITEQGSSGSGLWDQNRRLVGVLSGGDSSCENPGGSDYYGRFNVAWTANPTPDGQLKAHLDPDNSGRMTLDGLDPARPRSAPTPVAGRSGSGVLLGGALDGFLVSLLGLLGLLGLRRARCA